MLLVLLLQTSDLHIQWLLGIFTFWLKGISDWHVLSRALDLTNPFSCLSQSLGVIFDYLLILLTHIQVISISHSFYFQNVSQIYPLFSTSTLPLPLSCLKSTLISCLELFNSLPASSLALLQSIFLSAARLIY